MLMRSARAVALVSALAAPAFGQTGARSSDVQTATEVLGQVLSQRDSTSRTAGRAARSGKTGKKIPRGQLPPEGMCRVWIDGVPPGQQPAVTDCATAQAQAARTPNSRVLYGDDDAFPGKGKGKFKSHGRGHGQNDGRVDDDDEDEVRGGDDNESGVAAARRRAGDVIAESQRTGRIGTTFSARGSSRGHGRKGR